MFIQLKSKLASFICNKLLNCCDFQTAKGNRLDSCGRNPFWWLALMQRWKDSLLADLLNSVAGGGSPGFPSDPWIILTTRWVDVWFIAASLANVREKATVGIFISLAYKADFGYCGKSSKNSLNWRYAAWLLHASLVFQRSEIFLNFAPRPSLLPIFSPCPPALIQSPVCCAVDLLHPVTFCREKREKAMQREERGRAKASPECSAGGWRRLKFGISVAWFPGLECDCQECSSLSWGMHFAFHPPPPFFLSLSRLLSNHFFSYAWVWHVSRAPVHSRLSSSSSWLRS